MGNIIESFIRAFKPIPNYNIIINRCRLYNSFIGIYNIILIILNYSLFIQTNQTMLLHFLFVGTLIAIIANYIVEIKKEMRFLYAIILMSISLSEILIILIFIIIRLTNIFKICKLIENYYKKYSDLNNNTLKICTSQKIYYFFLIFCELLFEVLNGISIYLDLIAHRFIKSLKSYKNRRRKIK